jgi:hypothetical protein
MKQKKHKSSNQFTPVMPSSLKHTINDGMHSEVIQTGHNRGVSMQIGVDAPKAGKMSI